MRKIKRSIKLAYQELPCGIINTAKYHIEGRNVLIGILKRATNQKAIDIIDYLKKNNIEVYKLEEYPLHDNGRGK